MFKPVELQAKSQISQTGIRSIILLGLLIKAPRSIQEIRNAFVYYKVLDKDASTDIIRIDFNTLKAMGCKISRCSKKTGKYTLEKHPFSLKITSDDVKAIKKAYKKLKTVVDINKLIELDLFFEKISQHVFDEEIKEEILGISFLKRLNLSSIKNLVHDCKQNMYLTLIYRNPTKSEDSKKEIIAKKLNINNDKIYLHGYDIQKKSHVVLNCKRIKAIIGRRLSDKLPGEDSIKVLFQVNTKKLPLLTDDETIIRSDDHMTLLEGVYYNKFLAMQRMLSLAENCIVLEPLELRSFIVEKLKEMREVYAK